MKTYIYKYLPYVSNNWHSGGGAVIITDIDPQDEWNNYVENINLKLEEWEDALKAHALPEPDMVYECSATEKAVIVFEDAGCC